MIDLVILEGHLPRELRGQPHVSQISGNLRESLARPGRSVVIADHGDVVRRMQPGLIGVLGESGYNSAVLLDQADGPRYAWVRALLEPKPRQEYRVRKLSAEVLSRYSYAGISVVSEAEKWLASQLLDQRRTWIAVLGELARRGRLSGLLELPDRCGAALAVAPMTGGSHASSWLVRTAEGRDRVRKQVSAAGMAKLREEVGWLTRLDGPGRDCFAEVRASSERPDGVAVEFTYHDLPSLRSLVLSRGLTAEQATDRLCQVLAATFESVYRPSDDPVPGNYVRRTHLDRIAMRLAETAEDLPQFDALWRSDQITINGVQQQNLWPLVIRLTEAPVALNRLQPTTLMRIHGDLHFDNILVDPGSKEFKLVDPRGKDTYDTAYDLGKVLHSCNSLYDLIHSGMAEYRLNGSVAEYRYSAGTLPSEYCEIHRRFLVWLRSTEYARHEPNWFPKVQFAEAAHMASVMPFHIKHDASEEVAVICYLRAVELLNDYVRNHVEGAPR